MSMKDYLLGSSATLIELIDNPHPTEDEIKRIKLLWETEKKRSQALFCKGNKNKRQ